MIGCRALSGCLPRPRPGFMREARQRKCRTLDRLTVCLRWITRWPLRTTNDFHNTACVACNSKWKRPFTTYQEIHVLGPADGLLQQKQKRWGPYCTQVPGTDQFIRCLDVHAVPHVFLLLALTMVRAPKEDCPVGLVLGLLAFLMVPCPLSTKEEKPIEALRRVNTGGMRGAANGFGGTPPEVQVVAICGISQTGPVGCKEYNAPSAAVSHHLQSIVYRGKSLGIHRERRPELKGFAIQYVARIRRFESDGRAGKRKAG